MKLSPTFLAAFFVAFAAVTFLALSSALFSSSKIREWLTMIFLPSLENSMILNSIVSSTLQDVLSSLIRCFVGQNPSTPYCNVTIAPLSFIEVIVPSCIEFKVNIVSNTSQDL